jgi:hypothetical protein
MRARRARVASSTSTRKLTMEFRVRTLNDAGKNSVSTTAASDVISVSGLRMMFEKTLLPQLLPPI